MTFLRTVARIAVLAGAAGCVTLLLQAGRRNQSWLLLVLFTIWEIAPFAALAIADALSTGWSARMRGTLYGLMLVVSLGSLFVFSTGAFKPAGSANVFLFVAVPPVACLLIAVVLPISALLSRR